jgi:hypothetical protein
MRLGAPALLGGALALLLQQPASADENRDLDLIPETIQQQPKSPKPTPAAPAKSRESLHAKFYLEDAFTLPSAAHAIPVPVPSAPFDWQNRTSLDANVQWEPWKRLTVTLSDRLNVLEQDRVSLLSRQTVRNDFREGYVSWEAMPSGYLEAGRINVRNGVALGFSPTDFFKPRTLVGQASLDPSVIRQNRLGTMMMRGQTIWTRGSASIAFAPKLYPSSSIVSSDPLGIDPRFDATNAAYRLLCTLNLDIADLAPQALAYFELHRSKIGLSLSRQLGDAIVAYAEWTGGRETNLITRGVAYGQATGTLPLGAPIIPPTDTSDAFRNDVASGVSWTIASKVTLNLEYHFHQAGFTRRDWRNWFDIGSARGASAAVSGELWTIRGYANDQQEPVPMHQMFVRAAWPKAWVDELELTAFAFVDLLDGSTLAQLSASYYLSDAWTVGAYGSLNLGGARTERGSLPQPASAILQVVRYL